MRIPLSAIYAKKHQRPHGYVADCIANGIVEGEFITFTDEAWQMLIEKYRKPRGLGDTITSITQATGIAQVVDKVTGGGCGCGGRQDKLNELFPYKQP